MNEKIKFLFAVRRSWQVILLATVGAVLITDSVTVLASYWLWHEVQFNLIILGTINAILVPIIMLPMILRMLSKVIRLEEQTQRQREAIPQFARQDQVDAALTRRADEMSLLYQLGISLASGRDLATTLLALQTEILKLIQVDAFYVAIYDEAMDIVDYPIFYADGHLRRSSASRRLSEIPGLTGAVIFGKRTLYLPDIMQPETVAQYAPVADSGIVMHTFLGMPLMVNGKVIGVLSVQSDRIDAYSLDQIQLMENVAIQAAIAIHKARLLDQVQKELDEKSRMETQIHEREVILEAVAFAAEQFLKMPDWRANIDSVLERLGKTLTVTHAYLFEDHAGPQGEPVTSMRYEWTAPGYPSDLDGPFFQNSAIYQEGYIEQVETLKRGDARIGNSSTFNSIEKETMDALGVKAILEVPIFVNDREWGAIGFDDFERERNWSRGEVDALKIAAGVLSAAIQRQEAESAVRESERIFRRAIEAADAVPYYQDYKSDKYLFMGEGIFEMTGYHAEEMNPPVWSEMTLETVMLDESAGLSVVDAVELARHGKIKAWKCDQKIRTRDGRIRWLTDRSVELIDEQGESNGSIGILLDITDRKQTEADLRKRESTLEAITFAAEQFLKTADWRNKMDTVLERIGREFNASHAYLFEKNGGPDGETRSSMTYEWTAPDCITDLGSEAFQDLPPQSMGFERMYEILDRGEPLIGSSSYFSPAEREYLQSIGVKALLEIRIVVDEEHWGTIGVDEVRGEREWTTMEVDVIRVASNVLGAAIKRQRDEAALQMELEERKRLIEKLEIRNAESKTLRETTVIVTSTLDVAEAVKRILEQLKRVVAYDSASVWLYKDNIARMVGEDGLPEMIDSDKTYVVDESEPDYPLWEGSVPYVMLRDVQADYPQFRQPPINYIHAWLSIPLKARGKMIGFISLDGRQPGQFGELDAELALTYANQVSIALENARLFSELQEELAERKKLIGELENKNSELERFTYTVSHDLKSPLVTINGFLGFLAQDAASGNTERLKNDIQRIHEAVKKMQNLLNELLELSRIGRVVNPPETVSLNELVREAMSLVVGRVEARQVVVTVQPGLPSVYVDKRRIVEVLQNLLDNGAKYMGQQTQPRIEIGQRGEEAGKPIFYIRDNGIGIAPEFHDRVFGLFNKLDPRSDGTGVGLALVKRIIEVHGGRIWVESDRGLGCTFCFTLPTQPEPDSVL